MSLLLCKATRCLNNKSLSSNCAKAIKTRSELSEKTKGNKRRLKITSQINWVKALFETEQVIAESCRGNYMKIPAGPEQGVVGMPQSMGWCQQDLA